MIDYIKRKNKDYLMRINNLLNAIGIMTVIIFNIIILVSSLFTAQISNQNKHVCKVIYANLDLTH